jgi:probable phosphoglycerate mutase
LTTILLIRHGETDAVGKWLAGWSRGVGLNEAGRRQAERLAERLSAGPVDAIYSSPLERAWETAGFLARRLGIPVRECEELREVDFGEWTGRKLEDLEQDPLWLRFTEWRAVTRAPGGETMLESQARVVRGIERMGREHPGRTVAAFSHSDIIKAALAHFAAIPIDLCRRIEISPASVTVLALDGEFPRLLRVNDTGEWPPPSPKG